MAGRGRAPAENRRRRNVPMRGEWVDLEPLEAPVLPELPEGEWRPDWTPETVELWEAWRADPVTAQWSPSDVAFAVETIMLRNEKGLAAANEVRLRMDSLGLTPKGKRDLRWRLPKAEPEVAEVKPMPGRRLRAVG